MRAEFGGVGAHHALVSAGTITSAPSTARTVARDGRAGGVAKVAGRRPRSAPWHPMPFDVGSDRLQRCGGGWGARLAWWVISFGRPTRLLQHISTASRCFPAFRGAMAGHFSRDSNAEPGVGLSADQLFAAACERFVTEEGVASAAAVRAPGASACLQSRFDIQRRFSSLA